MIEQEKQKSLFFIVSTILLLTAIAAVAVWVYDQRNKIFLESPSAPVQNTVPATPFTNNKTTTPILSADGKTITAEGLTLLAIDNDEIFNWFRQESRLCDEANSSTNEERKSFCENKAIFRNKTRFNSITVSPDKLKVGFSITSDTLTPDTVVGIFIRPTAKVALLTNYYLGNEFIGFSPSGMNFVYQSNCWEGMCGLTIKDTETLTDRVSLNNPEFLDERQENITFIRWISDNEIEYKLGTKLLQKTF